MYWRRASIQDGQAFTSAWWCHCSETVFSQKKLYYFSSQIEKNSIFGINEFFYVCLFYLQIFNFRDGHVTTFRHPSAAYICQMPGHRLPRPAKAHLQSLGFPSVSLALGKLFPVGCEQDSRRVRQKREKCCFWIWPRPRYKIPDFFFTIAPVLTSTLTVCRQNRGDLSSLYRT